MLAVIVCSGEYGDQLAPITSELQPVALLPLGDGVLIDYALAFCEAASISDALVIAPKSQEALIASHLRTRRSKAELQTENASGSTTIRAFEDGTVRGSAEILKHAFAEGWIKSTFILLPPDLCLLPSLKTHSILSSLVDMHSRRANLITSLFFERSAAGEDLPKKLKKGAQYIVLDPRTSSLLDVKTIQDPADGIELRGDLQAYPQASVRRDLSSAGVHICSPRILTLLNALPAMRDLDRHLVPFLAKCQWQEGLMEKYVNSKSVKNPQHPQALAYAYSSMTPSQATVLAPRPIQNRPSIRSLPTAVGSVLVREQAELDLATQGLMSECASNLRAESHCAIRVWTKEDGFCSRATSLEGYAEANRAALTSLASNISQKTTQSAQTSRQVGTDSFVGANSVLAEKAVVKKSTIGKNVSIGKDVKVTNCILLDGVVIGDGTKLEGCIVAAYARIGDNVQLTKCEVASRFEVTAGVTAKNEQFFDRDVSA